MTSTVRVVCGPAALPVGAGVMATGAVLLTPDAPGVRVTVEMVVETGTISVEMEVAFAKGQLVTEGAHDRTVCRLVVYTVSVMTCTGAGAELLATGGRPVTAAAEDRARLVPEAAPTATPVSLGAAETIGIVTTVVEVGMSWVLTDWLEAGQLVTSGAHEYTVLRLVV